MQFTFTIFSQLFIPRGLAEQIVGCDCFFGAGGSGGKLRNIVASFCIATTSSLHVKSEYMYMVGKLQQHTVPSRSPATSSRIKH